MNFTVQYITCIFVLPYIVIIRMSSGIAFWEKCVILAVLYYWVTYRHTNLHWTAWQIFNKGMSLLLGRCLKLYPEDKLCWLMAKGFQLKQMWVICKPNVNKIIMYQSNIVCIHKFSKPNTRSDTDKNIVFFDNGMNSLNNLYLLSVIYLIYIVYTPPRISLSSFTNAVWLKRANIW